MHCTCQHKINRDTRALQSVTADFFAYRPFSRFFPSGCSRSGTLRTVWAKLACFTLLGIHRIDCSYVEARQISRSFWLAACPPAMATMFSRRHAFWHARWDPPIIMATHNNRDILMVPYEDLPDEDKDVISKAIEEFQNKCLLSIPRYVTIKLFRNIHYQEF